jgi:Spy/CpxP family protein refolding chaperone
MEDSPAMSSMRRFDPFFRTGFGVLLCMSAFASGCAPTDERGPNAPPRQYPAHPGFGEQDQQASATTMVVFALEATSLSNDQKNKIKQIKSELNAKLDARRAAERSLLGALADAVAAGSVDEGKLADLIARISDATPAAFDSSASAMNQLHAALDQGQRQGLAQEVVLRWSTSSGDPHMSKRFGRPDQLKLLIADLSLTSDQVSQILNRSTMTTMCPNIDTWRVDTHLHRLDAFGDDRFDGAAFVGDKAAIAIAAKFEAQRVTQLYGAVAPALKPEQRSLAAQRLRDEAKRIE